MGLTHDFLKPDGSLFFPDIGLDLLAEAPEIEWEFLKGEAQELSPDQIRGYDALIVLAPRVTATTLEGADQLILIARFGVGYDNVDIDACTQRGIMVTITPDGVRRPMAVAAMTFLLALSHKLLIKDRLTRSGRWAEKINHMGTGLTGRIFGLIGMGNIGRELVTLARLLDMRYLAYDPYLRQEDAAALGVKLVDLETLLREADFVCVLCPLTPETRHLINAERLSLMKPTAYLINVARGPIVDQKALTLALQEGRIQGAALDVFEQEPVDPEDPILRLENVIVAPHAIGWTDEIFRGNGRSACRSILDVVHGRVPRYLVDRSVLNHPRLREKLQYFQEGRGMR